MTAPVRGPGRGRRRLFWPQWAGALVAVAASLAALGLPGTARADTPGYDQMTGVGPTASAKTVAWTQGLLDNTNTPLASANVDPNRGTATNAFSFMYNDFKNLSVTVSQTQDIGHQGITVTWNWPGVQTVQNGTLQSGYLQMMECWGDATTGPTPAQCEYGSPGLLPSSANNGGIAFRSGPMCPTGSVPSTTSPPRAADGTGPADGCDTKEPSDKSHLAPCPATEPTCVDTDYTIPFDPVTDPNNPVYNPGTTYYSEFNTDEIQETITAADGTGQQQFETLTGVQATGLGCGLAENDGSARGCWLVIVPRGQYEPNGYQINPNSTTSFINTTPLAESNWAQRIQIHLGFAPVGSFCPPGTLERQTFGTSLAARAMQSWQLALNSSAKCAKVYGYSAVPETQATNNLTAGGASGLAFTTIPIGSEATRPGGSGTVPTLPTILYAPVAITAVTFGFNINYKTGYITTPVKLTPLLLAKALTQSYQEDLPDVYPQASKVGPAWVQANPLNISEDPQFQALNKELPADSVGPIAPLLTEDHSQVNQQVWQWIQGDSAATGWLGGTKDATDNNMAVDPDYQALNLGKAPALDSYPRAYNGVLDLTGLNPPEGIKHTLDLIPYIDNFDSAGSAVLTANSPDQASWDPTLRAPDGSLGWWHKVGVEPLGQIFIWGAVDTPDSAAYGLIPAQLCDGSGGNCVSPSTASITAALGAATADSSGVLHVDPAHPGTGGYPLTYVVYAAVPTNQSAAALNDYADLISYAAGTGQTPGATPGDLPPGYLPLPANLQTQAQAVVAQLRAAASPSPSPSVSASPSASSSTSSTGSSSSNQSSNTGTSTGTTTSTGSSTSTGGTSTGGAGAGALTGATHTPAPALATNTSPAATPVPTPAASVSKLPAASGSLPAIAAAGGATPGGPVISLPQAQPASGTTPNQAVGAVRWVLIGVAIVGAGFAGGGTLLSYGGLPPPPWRRRTLL